MLQGLEYSEEIFRQLRLLEIIIDSLSEGVAVGHRARGLVLFNSAARDILGQPLTNEPPENWSKHYGIFYPDGKTLIPLEKLPMVQALQGRALLQFEMIIRNEWLPEGRPISADAFPIDADLALVVFRDMTLARRHEQALQNAKEAAEKANRAKTEFLANISHEIRSPIGAILGFSRLLRESSELKGESGNWLKTIERNASHLSSLVEGTLDLSKIESGQMSVELEQCSLPVFLDETMEPLAQEAKSKGLEFMFEISGKLPDSFVTDLVALRRMVINIVGNAIKFTDNGFVKVLVKPDPAHNDTIEMIVQDTGVGMEPEMIPRLFRPFSQADSSRRRRFPGSGLGLILSRRLAEMLGGSLTLSHTSKGLGSTFQLKLRSCELPANAQARRRNAAPLAAYTEAIVLKPLRDVRVLVVEDSLDNQILLRHILGRAGAEVIAAADGMEGVRLAESMLPDVVLMDIQMPRLDGCEATYLLRQRGFSRPIIALTAHALKQEREHCMAAGCNEYMTKPIDPQALVQRITSFLVQGQTSAPVCRREHSHM